MSHEHIIAACVYILDRDDALQGGELCFKRAYTVEEAGRLLVERYLGPNEDATGFRIELTHEGPAFVGDRVTITAWATQVTDQECVCEFEARGPSGLVGQGVFVQRYVPRGKLEAAARQRRHGG